MIFNYLDKYFSCNSANFQLNYFLLKPIYFIKKQPHDSKSHSPLPLPICQSPIQPGPATQILQGYLATI